MNKKRIYNEITAIRSNYYLNDYAKINLNDLIKQLENVKVIQKHFNYNKRFKVNNDNRSSIRILSHFKKDNKLIKIIVDEELDDYTKRFAIMKALGIYFLEKKYNDYTITTGINDDVDKQIDYFAAEFLVPKDALLKIIKKNKINNIYRLSEMFKVPMSTINKRIEYLEEK